MTEQFTGWPRQAFDVLMRLEGLPSAETRQQVRKDRERLVRLPMIALLGDLAGSDSRYEDFSVWSYGKDPFWWQNQCATVRLARCVELTVRLNLDGLHVKAAWHYPDPGQVPRYRAAVAADGHELTAILESLRAKGYEITGDVMKRAPRQYPADHPHADLLRHRSIIANTTLSDEDELWTPRASAWLAARAEELDDLLGWLARSVAEPVPQPG
ncbi:DUF2461 family protein [Kibdelosporangium phytohabitans]|uniref:DUF2461 domain-containing protein n=1 Tax=Kibdelosporangium phytohabitans TaxID=860235 RepID=A0A0N9I8H3_9PSEU|nr:DUF2461 family protein [Kibdelosporangium phytohabitans]ALG10802.1 hypothetical protein AOZ06_31450 [Kibdelosporangium phytohabitans]MBE1461968.1 uncharacterized protein (DUF2461 family) [Kibdelosporangium phytohabitans]